MVVFYWVIYFLLLFLSFAEQFVGLRKNICNKICGGFMLLFLFLSTIRWEQNVADWESYYEIYNRYQPSGLGSIFDVDWWSFEFLFTMMQRIVKYFGDYYLAAQFVMAAIGIGVFYFAALYFNNRNILNDGAYGEDKSYIITVYLIFWSAGFANIFTVRTNMAAALCLFSIRYIEKKDFKRFIMLIVIATGIHFTSIVFIPAYYIYHRKVNRNTYVRVAGAALVLGTIGVERILRIVSMFGGYYAFKVTRYIGAQESADVDFLNFSTGFAILRSLSNTILVFVIIILVVRSGKVDKRLNGMINLYLLGAIIQFVTGMYSYNMERVALYYMTLQYFLIPRALKITDKSTINKTIMFMVLAIYTCFRMYTLIHSRDGYMSFNTVFSN